MQAVVSGHLDTGLHQVYYAAYGNPQGTPFLFVHGGPGGGTSPSVLQFFDLNQAYVVLVDQRGCGQSRPLGEIQANTTQDLLADFEAIRAKLSIKTWVLFGGSWGSTLALVYAQSYPQAVSGLILRGIFLGGQAGIDWLTKANGAAQIFPEAWAELLASVPELAKTDKPVEYLYESVKQGQQELAIAFARWEGRISCHSENAAVIESMSTWPVGYTVGKLELHYMAHNFFLEDEQIMQHLGRIQVPVAIVHGRYDVVCPVAHAVLLANELPQAKLQIMPNSGHSALEPEIMHCLMRLTQEFCS